MMASMTNTSACPSAPPSDIEINQRTLQYFYLDLSAFKNKQNYGLGQDSYVTSGDLKMYAKVRIQSDIGGNSHWHSAPHPDGNCYI